MPDVGESECRDPREFGQIKKTRLSDIEDLVKGAGLLSRSFTILNKEVIRIKIGGFLGTEHGNLTLKTNFCKRKFRMSFKIFQPFDENFGTASKNIKQACSKRFVPLL